MTGAAFRGDSEMGTIRGSQFRILFTVYLFPIADQLKNIFIPVPIDSNLPWNARDISLWAANPHLEQFDSARFFR